MNPPRGKGACNPGFTYPQPVRIVHFLKSIDLKGGGVTRAVLDLCTGMTERGHELVLLTGEDDDVDAAWKVPRGGDAWELAARGTPACVHIPVRDLRRELKGHKGYKLGPDFPTHYVPRAGREAARAVIERADVLHLHGPWASPNLQLARIARKVGVPYVLTAHGMLDDWCMNEHAARKKIYHRLFSRSLLENAIAVHCTAQGEAEQSSKLFPRGRAAVVPLLVDMSPFRALPGPELARAQFPQLNLPGAKLLCISRLNKVKGLERVLRAAATLKQNGQALQLIFAGPADPADYADVLRARAKELGLGDNLHLLGMVGGVEKISLYQAADVYVQPSIHENFGLSLVESLAAGTPIITAKGVNIWPELHASGGAVIVENSLNPQPTDDEGELRLAIASLLADPARRAAMGAAGRRWALELLDQDRTVAAYEAMYRGEPVGTPPPSPMPARRTGVSLSSAKAKSQGERA